MTDSVPAHITLDVVDQAAAEACDAVVCVRIADMPVGHFPDDVIVDCALGCGFQVRHRPYMPKAPPKVCMQCGLDLATAVRQ
jgi:hypothetical protein